MTCEECWHLETHMIDQQTRGPLCVKEDPIMRTEVVVQMSSDINKVDCATCLRMLAKDAVMFGNGRRARRS